MANELAADVCGAVVCIITSNLQVSTVVHELQNFMMRIPPPLCVVLNEDGAIPNIENKLTTDFPGLLTKPECLVVKDVSMPVQGQGGFKLKKILDSNKISSFVVLATKERLEKLIVVMDIIFTMAYHTRVKVYGGSYVNVPAILTAVSEDLKSSLKKNCFDYLASSTANPQEKKVQIIKSDLICDDVFVHGFSTRKGGCSTYPSVSSLNLAFNVDKRDPPIVVEENRHRLLKADGAPSHKFQLAKAVHGNTVWTIGSQEPTGYDAIVCDKPGIVIAAPAADCVTVILGDASKSVCAAVHSGWKGTLANIIGVTIETMSSHFGCKIPDIRAAIGPSIGACCYEIGVDVEKLFSSHSLLGQCLETVEGKGKKHLNLQKALRLQLEEAGISYDRIDDTPSKLCTYCNEDKFYSYRRDGKPFGTHVGFIGLR